MKQSSWVFSKKEIFSNAGKIFKIAGPLTIVLIGNYFLFLIDTAFVGHYKNPAIGLAILNSVIQIHFVIVGFIYSLTQGTTIVISKYLGAGEIKKASKVAESAFLYIQLLCYFFALVWLFFGEDILRLMNVRGEVLKQGIIYARFTSLSYVGLGVFFVSVGILQSLGKTHSFIVASVIKAVLNVVLDYCFIFGKFGFPEMGVSGAAVGTALSEIIGGGVLIIIAFRNKIIPINIGNIFRSSVKPLAQALKLGSFTGVQSIVYALGQLVILAFLNILNPLNSGYYGLILNLINISYFLYAGIGSACMTMSAFHHGQKTARQINLLFLLGIIFSCIICLVISFFYLFFPKEIVHILTKEDTMVKSISSVMPLLCILLFPKVFNVIIDSVLRGASRVSYLLISQVICTILIIIVSYILILKFHLGLSGILICLLFDEMVRLLIDIPYYFYTIRKLRRNNI